MNYFTESLNENKKILEPHLYDRLTRSSEFANLLIPLLTALHWPVNARAFIEALPYQAECIEDIELRNILARLSFSSHIIHQPLEDISANYMPYVYIPHGQSAMLVLKNNGDTYTIWNSVSQQIEHIDPQGIKGTGYLFAQDDSLQNQSQAWFKLTLQKFRRHITQMVLISLFINLLTLATPLFVLFAYDYILPSESNGLLLNITCAVLFVLGVGFLLQKNRHHILHFLSSRMDKLLAETVLQKIIYLPSPYIENARMSDQVNRIKSFDHIHRFLSSPMVQGMLELPFVVLAFGIIGLLAGKLIIIPLVGFSILALAYWVFLRKSQTLQKQLYHAHQQRDHLLSESIHHHATIKTHAVESTWINRFKQLQTYYSLSRLRMNFVQHTVNTSVDTIIQLTVIAMIVFCARAVIASELSVGALIAIFMLTWRILGPVKMMFNFLPNWKNFTTQVEQFNHLMNLQSEKFQQTNAPIFTTKKGVLELAKISFRYQKNAPMALRNVSFKINPKEVVALVGRNGSGKSTLLKLIPRFYQPQLGHIFLDGVNISHIPTPELRQQIAYLPQTNQIFSGTIEENLQSANPTASQTEIIEAVTLAGIFNDIQKLPEKFQTNLDISQGFDLPYHFQQGLALARTYLKPSRVYLFDEPAAGLTPQQNQAFLDEVHLLRQHATVIIATHRADHIDIADRIIYLDNGQIQYDGPAEKIRHRLSMDML